MTCAIYARRMSRPNLYDDMKEDNLPSSSSSFEQSFNLWSVVKHSYKVMCQPILQTFAREFYPRNQRTYLRDNNSADTLFLALAGTPFKNSCHSAKFMQPTIQEIKSRTACDCQAGYTNSFQDEEIVPTIELLFPTIPTETGTGTYIIFSCIQQTFHFVSFRPSTT